MPDPQVTFLARLIVAANWTGRAIRRIAIALLVFGRALYDTEYARAFNRGAKLPRPAAPTATLDQAPPDSALLLLGLLQRTGCAGAGRPQVVIRRHRQRRARGDGIFVWRVPGQTESARQLVGAASG